MGEGVWHKALVGGGGGGGLVYGNWPSTAPKAGHVTDLRLTLCAPPQESACDHAFAILPISSADIAGDSL